MLQNINIRMNVSKYLLHSNLTLLASERYSIDTLMYLIEEKKDSETWKIY